MWKVAKTIINVGIKGNIGNVGNRIFERLKVGKTSLFKVKQGGGWTERRVEGGELEMKLIFDDDDDDDDDNDDDEDHDDDDIEDKY